MATIRCNGNWVQFDSHDNQCFEDVDEEEALSLCDLPTNNINLNESESNSNKEDIEPEDFQFGPSNGVASILSPENMCNADEVFFQGQILPVGLTRKINRSVSMSDVGSRTSRTMTNGKDPRTLGSNEYGYRYRYEYDYRYKPKMRNQFHSHPSPSPQIRTQSFRTVTHSNAKPSSLWSFLQVGLVKPQEIGLSELKNRSKRFGSHNSNSSSTSSSMNSASDQIQIQSKQQNKIKHPLKNSKKKQRLFFDGCKCSAVSTVGTMKDTVPKKKESTMIGEWKQTVSRHRTFEWLKQLSIAAPSEA